MLKYYTIPLILPGKSTCRYLKRTLTSNKVWTDDIVGEVSIYLMTRLVYVQCNFSASFQYIKLRNSYLKALDKIGVTTFIKSYRSNDCKSMVCVQYDIPAILIYVKDKIVYYIWYCIARDVMQKMVALLKNMVRCKYGRNWKNCIAVEIRGPKFIIKQIG